MIKFMICTANADDVIRVMPISDSYTDVCVGSIAISAECWENNNGKTWFVFPSLLCDVLITAVADDMMKLKTEYIDEFVRLASSDMSLVTPVTTGKMTILQMAGSPEPSETVMHAMIDRQQSLAATIWDGDELNGGDYDS